MTRMVWVYVGLVVLLTGCSQANGTKDWAIESLVPQVSTEAQEATNNLLRDSGRDTAVVVAKVATAIQRELELGRLVAQPETATGLVEEIVRRNAPTVARDQSVMLVIRTAISIAGAKVDEMYNTDRTIAMTRFLWSAMDGVKRSATMLSAVSEACQRWRKAA